MSIRESASKTLDTSILRSHGAKSSRISNTGSSRMDFHSLRLEEVRHAPTICLKCQVLVFRSMALSRRLLPGELSVLVRNLLRIRHQLLWHIGIISDRFPRHLAVRDEILSVLLNVSLSLKILLILPILVISDLYLILHVLVNDVTVAVFSRLHECVVLILHQG